MSKFNTNHYTTGFTPISNHITGVTYECKIYMCGKRAMSGSCYCQEHTSPLRTGKPVFSPESAPVIKIHPWRANVKINNRK